MVRPLPLLLLGLCCAAACDATTEAPPASVPLYLQDGGARRGLLEAALWRPELPYSSELLDSYGLESSGWDLLREQPSASRPFTVADATELAAGRALGTAGMTELLPASPPATQAGWQALGEQVFTSLSLRSDPYLSWLAANPDRWPEFGVTPRADGTVRGLVVVGGGEVGVTCAFCHGGSDVMGRGDRALDVGAIRAGHAAGFGRQTAALRAWGPGRADVTDDGVGSVTAIPDLWGLADARYLNHSGAIAVASRDTLAVRFETQYIKGHRMRTRPARTLMWALAQFIVGLAPPDDGGAFATQPAPSAKVSEGEAAFSLRCASCHAPDASFSGGLVPAADLDVDPAVAMTPERGTGSYKVPSLVAVRANAPYLHDGSVPTLDALVASGHPRGDVLSAATRDALVAYLNTL